MEPTAEKIKEEAKKVENLRLGSSINLVPRLTEAEIKVESSKIKINTSAAIALFVLFALSLLIVGANIVTKLDLNAKRKQLFNLEGEIRLKENVLSSNDEILRRVTLFEKIEETTYSSKDAVLYWQEISKGLAKITEISLSKGLNFEVTGTATTLTDVSKLWYILGNDEKIVNINLKSVTKSQAKVNFKFEGLLNFDEFVKENG